MAWCSYEGRCGCVMAAVCPATMLFGGDSFRCLVVVLDRYYVLSFKLYKLFLIVHPSVELYLYAM